MFIKTNHFLRFHTALHSIGLDSEKFILTRTFHSYSQLHRTIFGNRNTHYVNIFQLECCFSPAWFMQVTTLNNLSCWGKFRKGLVKGGQSYSCCFRWRVKHTLTDVVGLNILITHYVGGSGGIASVTGKSITALPEWHLLYFSLPLQRLFQHQNIFELWFTFSIDSNKRLRALRSKHLNKP